jgi:type II secretory pathway pseudopilin PulG
MAWMGLRTRAGSRDERGFTLAGVIVLMTIMMVFVAYTVPRQWSTVMQRERELETIFVMKQYARAIDEFSKKNGNALPVSMDQLKKAKMPRFLRGKDGEYPDPLTGQVDWLIIPASAAGATGPVLPGTSGSGPGTPPPAGSTANPQTQQGTVPTVPAIAMKDYAGGPFIGVRPGKSGKSFLEFNNAQDYEQWSYTVNDYRNERNARLAAAAKIWQ